MKLMAGVSFGGLPSCNDRIKTVDNEFASSMTTKEISMNNENNRVLGRVLAVEETIAVAGAKATATCLDRGITLIGADTSVSADCTQAQLDSGTLADTGTTGLDQNSGA